MDYKKLLKKYIEHVGVSEGTTFLGDHHRNEWNDSVEFTDEEWAALQALDRVLPHSCSCHVNKRPCGVCKDLGCTLNEE